MCDWETQEYAEYLLWVDAAKARARAQTGSTGVSRTVEHLDHVVVPAPLVEA